MLNTIGNPIPYMGNFGCGSRILISNFLAMKAGRRVLGDQKREVFFCILQKLFTAVCGVKQTGEKIAFFYISFKN
jgi:hypothetical protein